MLEEASGAPSGNCDPRWGGLLAAVNDTSTLCQKHRVVLYGETDKLIVPYTSCQHLVKTSCRIVREDRRADRKKHMKCVFLC